eukprot:CAMPEP_0119140332 /NCGR_PEP_ID=MMETSP1310-20130426/29045_1 /TAXON_ID=464262 /ORGANISM="Genus nov. species nov., Strain RCC2339" /LENGTH=246 /DNA_ID=CAMNT_0007131681 /DNA_START=1 /DNA_END=741 /DNA_ORIENTATION=+
MRGVIVVVMMVAGLVQGSLGHSAARAFLEGGGWQRSWGTVGGVREEGVVVPCDGCVLEGEYEMPSRHFQLSPDADDPVNVAVHESAVFSLGEEPRVKVTAVVDFSSGNFSASCSITAGGSYSVEDCRLGLTFDSCEVAGTDPGLCRQEACLVGEESITGYHNLAFKDDCRQVVVCTALDVECFTMDLKETSDGGLPASTIVAITISVLVVIALLIAAGAGFVYYQRNYMIHNPKVAVPSAEDDGDF